MVIINFADKILRENQTEKRELSAIVTKAHSARWGISANWRNDCTTEDKERP
jgi:hypothetical protein